MRTYKFRYFDKEDKTMNGFGSMPMPIADLAHLDEEDHIIVMQYTGLKDKNGVDIYEGDIVAASFWDDEQKIYSETASVEFEEGSFILKLPNDEWSYFNGTQSVEVIGNIHEHPNLLEVSTE